MAKPRIKRNLKDSWGLDTRSLKLWISFESFSKLDEPKAMSTVPTLKLTQYKDSKQVVTYFLSHNFSIGRNNDFSDLCTHSSISRNHISVSVIGSTIYIEDNWSANGTHINDKLIPYNEQVRYKNGDRILLGNSNFYFTLELVEYDPTLPLREITNSDTQISNNDDGSKITHLTNVAELNVKKIFYFIKDYKVETLILMLILSLIIYYFFVR